MAVEGLLATTTDLHPRRVFRRGSTSEAAWWDVLREDALLRTRCTAAAYLYWIARGVAAFVGNNHLRTAVQATFNNRESCRSLEHVPGREKLGTAPSGRRQVTWKFWHVPVTSTGRVENIFFAGPATWGCSLAVSVACAVFFPRPVAAVLQPLHGPKVDCRQRRVV